jgi:hypothetical protein
MNAAIAASSELQERDALKRLGLANAFAKALENRGIDDMTASLAAELGVLALKRAQWAWSKSANSTAFREIAHQSLKELRTANSKLS